MVTAAYLLNFAQSEADLLSMIRGAFHNLAPGGRLVGLSQSMILDDHYYHPETSPLEKFGISLRLKTKPRKDGTKILCSYLLPDGSRFKAYCYWYSPATFAKVGIGAKSCETAWQPSWECN